MMAANFLQQDKNVNDGQKSMALIDLKLYFFTFLL